LLLAAALAACQPDDGEPNAINRQNKADALLGAAAIERMQPAIQPTSASAVDVAIAEPAVAQAPAVLLKRLHADLRALAAGKRSRPVTIVHIGDDHVAADRLTGELRRLFQSRFGDAGRGLLMPPGLYRGQRADGVRVSLEGRWRAETATSLPEGGFGLTGARTIATAKGDRMTLDIEGGFDTAEVVLMGGPEQGRAAVSIDGQVTEISTKRKAGQLVRVLSQRPGKQVAVSAVQSRPVAVSGIMLGRNRPGVRYVNIGLPGADIGALAGLDQALAGDELAKLAPSLIVIGFGTIAGFNDDLDKTSYAVAALSLVKRIRSWSPEAALAIVGPPDAVRLPDYAGSAARESGDTACRALSLDEIGGYRQGIAAADPRLARWHPPVNLADVREVWRRVAGSEGAYFWDWHEVMGGDCSIHAWAYADPPLASHDHVLLTEAGYRRSADGLFQQLVSGMMSDTSQAAPPAESQ
jgi:hypothetical protein